MPDRLTPEALAGIRRWTVVWRKWHPTSDSISGFYGSDGSAELTASSVAAVTAAVDRVLALADRTRCDPLSTPTARYWADRITEEVYGE